MARGDGGGGGVAAMEMSKWFDTNYHYIVPELGPGQTFRLGSRLLLDQVGEARAAGVRARPVLLGPLTYLRLGKPTVEGFDPLNHAEAILSVYEQVLRELSRSVEWLQLLTVHREIICLPESARGAASSRPDSARPLAGS